MENRRYVQYLATFAVALASMTASVSYSWTVPVIPKFHNNETDIKLTDNEISWVVASAPPGMIVGCLAARHTSDAFGRRTTLLGTALPFTVGTVFVVLAKKAWMLYLARFFWGLGAGAIAPVCVMYVSEIASKDIRGSLTVITRFLFTFGSFLVVSVGAIASYQALSYMLVALSICYFLACLAIPETPYYLLKQEKVPNAKAALMKLNGYKDELILDEKLAEMRAQVRNEMQNSGTIKELLTGQNYRKAVIVALGLRCTQILVGCIALQQYLGRILQETHSDFSVSTGIILYSSVRLTVSMVASFVIDKVGRRPLLIASYSGACVILTTLGTIFFFHEVLDKTPPYLGFITLGCLMLFTIVATLGFDTVNFVIPVEIFPINVKATAITSLNVFMAALTFVVLKGYQMLKDLSGLYGAFWFFACFALVGAVFSYLVVPETRGKSLKEIQVEFQGEFYQDQDKLAAEKLTTGESQEGEDTENLDSDPVKV